MEDEVLKDLEGPSGSLRRRDKLVGFLDGDAHRLLQRNDFPGVDRFQRRLQVQVVRQKQLHQVDVVPCKQPILIVVDVHFSAPPRMRPFSCQIRVAVAERRDLRRRVLQVLDGMQVGNAAGSDEGDSEGLARHGQGLSFRNGFPAFAHQLPQLNHARIPDSHRRAGYSQGGDHLVPGIEDRPRDAADSLGEFTVIHGESANPCLFKITMQNVAIDNGLGGMGRQGRGNLGTAKRQKRLAERRAVQGRERTDGMVDLERER